MFWYDDMGTTFFSPDMYRRMLKPYHTKAVKWAHDHAIVAQLHSCGDVRTLVPDLLETGGFLLLFRPLHSQQRIAGKHEAHHGGNQAGGQVLTGASGGKGFALDPCSDRVLRGQGFDMFRAASKAAGGQTTTSGSLGGDSLRLRRIL